MRRVVAAMTSSLLLTLAGCAAGAGAGDADGAVEARTELVDFLQKTAMSAHTTDVNDVARAAVGLQGPRLIGIDPAESPSDSSIGTLTFVVWVAAPPYTGTDLDADPDPDPVPRCVEVEFDPWGKVGEFGTDDGLTSVECPADLTEVAPPPSGEPAAAPNAEEAIRQVLEALPADDADADAIAQQITALLEEPEDGRPLAEVQVEVDGTSVGVATGGPDDCVMLVRGAAGVSYVHVSPVQLQPGESGCNPWTALDPPPPPH
ncbi:hypothetical protein CSO01_21010 [Cellulomonas soli]|uniref:Lipoprotein n=1 Tax=Cellulomonas soli TaxID=931535 RepID=A0A512PE14_9CELL|nr:hypothetical protein CSO01_21010 [Cellulomonas soli]